MSTEFSIAPLTDIARIGELHSLVLNAFRDLAIDPPSSVLKETVADFAARLKTETALVAEVHGSIIQHSVAHSSLVGGVFCADTGDSLYVGRLAVRGDARRLGVASALLEAAKAEARGLGLGRLTLSTRIALTSNVALFRKHGFVVTAEQSHPGFSHPTFYDMELRLV